jgi:hypothetical protein
MKQHLYFSLMPEALIASNLEPDDFGAYFSIGTEGKTRGQAAFFEIDPTFRNPFFPIDEGLKRCVPHPDGKPKSSVYISVYRVAEHIPLSSVGQLNLTTQDGRNLGIDKVRNLPVDEEGLHLYHEIAPLHPLIVSSLGPQAFHAFLMKGGEKFLSVPALCWADLRLDELANNPETGAIKDLPYQNVDHLRSCLTELKKFGLKTKMVDRIQPPSFLYRTIKHGIFFGTGEGLSMYALPSRETLLEKHYHWWRSANM